MKCLLQEDDCAPDAREYFFKDLENKFGLSYFDFHVSGEFQEVDDGMTLQWKYGKYILEISADDPYYKLRENEDD